MMTRATLPLLVIVAFAGSIRVADAQASTPRAGQGGVTFTTQVIDHIGRVFDDQRFDCCATTNVAIALDVDYGLTNRWSVSATLPFVFAKYNGEPPSPEFSWLPYQEVDSCHCLHGGFQDLGIGVHYNLMRVRRSFSLVTSASIGQPTHNYEYAGEAVIGFGLTELALSADASKRLDFIAPGLSVDGHYGYTIVERALDISHNRSNVRLTPSYAFPRHIEGHMILAWQHTNGGLHFPDDIQPYPERYSEFHRLLQDNYFQAGAGASFTWHDWDLSMAVLGTVSGSNTHNVRVYTFSAGHSFRFTR